jgi:hypothetical protein
MPYIGANLPYKGWTTDTQFSTVPPGFSQDMLNIMPVDQGRRRLRLSSRAGFNPIYEFGSAGPIQCMVRCVAYTGASGALKTVIKDRTIVVKAGVVYYLEQGGVPTVCSIAGGASAPVNTPALNASVSTVEGVQFNDYVYLCDGINYVKVDISLTVPEVKKWVDPYSHVAATVGTSHNYATLIARYGARIVLSGVADAETNWFMSRIDNPEDFNPTNDVEDAIAGSGSEYGTLGDRIIALIPLGNTGMLFAGQRSMSYLTVDPALDPNPQIITLSRSIGIVGSRAYCYGPEKIAYILGYEGLYRVSPNDFSLDRGNLISLNVLDSFFSKAQWEDIDAVLTYDVELRGVWIWLTRKDQPSVSVHLFYSEQTGGFFPQRLYEPEFYGAISSCQAIVTDGRTPVVLMGSAQGKIGYFDYRIIAGIDGYPASGYSATYTSPTPAESVERRVLSNLSIGPMLGDLGVRVMLRDVLVELNSEEHLPDTAVKGNLPRPTLALSYGDTAEKAIASSLTTVRFVQVLSVTVDGGVAGTSSFDSTIDGDDVTPTTITAWEDGGYAPTSFGNYEARSTFVEPEDRVYDGAVPDSEYKLQREVWDSSDRWVVYNSDNTSIVYVQQALNGVYSEDPTVGEYRFRPDGVTTSAGLQSDDTANFEGVLLEAENLALGELYEGNNNHFRCRVRAGAAYLQISSQGYPWALERASVLVDAVGMRRNVREVT